MGVPSRKSNKFFSQDHNIATFFLFTGKTGPHLQATTPCNTSDKMVEK